MSETFKTSDMYVAAYLKTKGVKLIDVVREENRAFFVFKGSGLWDMADGYYNNEDVKVGTFVKAVQDVKSLIFDTRGEE